MKKIKIIENVNGLYLSVSDFCEYLHYQKCITEKQSKNLYWKLLKEMTTNLSYRVKHDSIDNNCTPIITDVQDFYMSWTFFERARKFVKKQDSNFNALLRLIDSPEKIQHDEDYQIIFTKQNLLILNTKASIGDEQ